MGKRPPASRVLVTGHLGYIGTVLTRQLMQRGHDVAGLDSDLYRRCSYGGPLPDVPGLRKDVRDIDIRDLAGFDAVIHLAGLSNDPLGSLDPALTREINSVATLRLARLARTAGVERFVFSSSCSTYGASGSDLLDETSEFHPVTPYGVSKVDAERGLLPLASADFAPVFLRSATAFGLSPRLRFDLVVNNLTAWAFTTGEVRLKSDGAAWRPLVHVEDICRAFVAVLEAPADVVRGEAFNVGITSENLRVRDIAGIVSEAVPGSSIVVADGGSADRRCYRVSCDKLALALPDYRPSWTVRQGVDQLLAAFAEYGLEHSDFEGPRFRREAHLRKLRDDGLLDASLRFSASSSQPV